MGEGRKRLAGSVFGKANLRSLLPCAPKRTRAWTVSVAADASQSIVDSLRDGIGSRAVLTN